MSKTLTCSLFEVAPWLLAVGGLVVALAFARNDADAVQIAPPQPVQFQLSADLDGLELGQPHILVNGIASIDVVPDVADVTVVLSVERASTSEAVTLMREQQAQMVAVLAEAGIWGTDLRVSQMSVSPVYEDYAGGYRRRIRGYVSSITFVATLHDFDTIGDVLGRVSVFEVSDLSTHFRSTKITAKKQQLRDMALVAARDKARQSAGVLDVELGAVLSIEEVNRNDRGGWGALGNMSVNEFVADPTLNDGGVVPGAVTLSLTIEVEYALVNS